MAEPDNLILEHLRALRGEISKLPDEMVTIRIEMTAMRQHMMAIMAIQELDHANIAGIKVCLDRIEKRLELVH